MADQNKQNLIVVAPGTFAFEKFELKSITPFFERSVSEETRRAYRRIAKEFFTYFRFKHPAEFNQSDIHRTSAHSSIPAHLCPHRFRRFR